LNSISAVANELALFGCGLGFNFIGEEASIPAIFPMLFLPTRVGEAGEDSRMNLSRDLGSYPMKLLLVSYRFFLRRLTGLELRS
jgi:hypothetical protein